MLGYTQVLWDNAQQPVSAEKSWIDLTEAESAAAAFLGYTKTIWDNESGSEQQPVSAFKDWDELTSCGEAEIHSCTISCLTDCTMLMGIIEVFGLRLSNCSFLAKLALLDVHET